MKMNCKILRYSGNFALGMFVILMLVACGTDTKSSPDTDVSEARSAGLTEEHTYEWSLDQVFVENTGSTYGVQTAADGSGVYYTKGGKIAYYDCETDLSMVMCAQQGCSHSDVSCVAWQGDMYTFGVYHDLWYAVLEEDGGVLFRRTDPVSNSRENLFELPAPDEDSYYDVGNLSFSYGYAYFPVLTYTESYNETLGFSSIEVSAAKLICLELNEQEVQVLPFENVMNVTFVGGNKTNFAVACETLDTSALLSPEEYYSENPDVEETYEGEAYVQYYSIYTLTPAYHDNELRLYDKETGEYEVLASGTDLVISDRGKICYGDVIAYELLDRTTGESELWLYDLDTKQNICLAQAVWITEYMFLDEKVFFIVSVDEGYDIYYADIYTGEVTQIENQGSKEAMQYTLTAETNDYFIAYLYTYESLNKEDYYVDDYSTAKQFN